MNYDFGDYSEDVNKFLYRNKIPESTVENLRKWVMYGIPAGDFLNAVLDDKLTEAICRADKSNLAALKSIVLFIYNCLPAGCKNRAKWHGLMGDE